MMAVAEDKTHRALANKQKDLRHHLQVNWGRSQSFRAIASTRFLYKHT